MRVLIVEDNPDAREPLADLCAMWGDPAVMKHFGGVGSTREPRRYLAPGEEIASTIEGIGTMRNRCVAGAGA